MWYKEIFYRLAIFGIKDTIEIFCITNALYFFSIWLKQDRQKPLVIYFYSMCSFVIITYLMELPTLSNSLMALYPTMIMLFILIHQKSLQKNFILLKNTTATQITPNWLETLLRSCIIAANNKQPINCLIEGIDSLADHIFVPFMIKSALQPNLLDTLLSSTSYNPNKMLWLSSTGMLLSINAEWQITGQIVYDKVSDLDNWQKNSILFTAQTDALIFRLNPHNKSFDIITEGKLIEKIPTDQAIKLMHKHFVKKDLNKNRKAHDVPPKNHCNKQPTP